MYVSCISVQNLVYLQLACFKLKTLPCYLDGQEVGSSFFLSSFFCFLGFLFFGFLIIILGCEFLGIYAIVLAR